MTRFAVFDCDGTLVDSQASICTAMGAAFAQVGRDPPGRAAVLGIIGLSLIDAMRVLAPGVDDVLHVGLAEEYKRQFQRLRAEGAVDEPLFSGMAEAVTALGEAGWLLGIATGKSDRGLRLCLEQHRLTHLFATLQTADRFPSKPHPAMIVAAMEVVGAEPADTVVIGDTSYDMVMACAAGARAVGVSWGYHHVDDLLGAGASIVLDHPSQLLEELGE